MFKLSLIVCNSGLGHVNRVLRVLKFMLQETSSIKVCIFVDKRKLSYFEDILYVKSLEQIEIMHIKENVLNYESAVTERYETELRTADLVWSDNLLFPLKYNENVLLTGSFLWLDEIGGRFAQNEYTLLDKIRPTMIGCRYFATSSVREHTDFRGVGLYRNATQNLPRFGKGKNILLASGNTNSGRELFKENLGLLSGVVEKYSNREQIMIDKNIARYFRSIKGVSEASFGAGGMASIGAAVIRPGLGTVCDLWSRGAILFPIFEKESVEMSNNAKVIIDLQGVGSSEKADAALQEAIQIMSNSDLRGKIIKKIATLQSGGIESTARIIMSSIRRIQCQSIL